MAFVLIINIGFLLYLAYNILSFEMIKNLKLIIPLIAFSLLHLSLLLPLSEREKEVEPGGVVVLMLGVDFLTIYYFYRKLSNYGSLEGGKDALEKTEIGRKDPKKEETTIKQIKKQYVTLLDSFDVLELDELIRRADSIDAFFELTNRKYNEYIENGIEYIYYVTSMERSVFYGNVVAYHYLMEKKDAIGYVADEKTSKEILNVIEAVNDSVEDMQPECTLPEGVQRDLGIAANERVKMLMRNNLHKYPNLRVTREESTNSLISWNSVEHKIIKHSDYPEMSLDMIFEFFSNEFKGFFSYCLFENDNESDKVVFDYTNRSYDYFEGYESVDRIYLRDTQSESYHDGGGHSSIEVSLSYCEGIEACEELEHSCEIDGINIPYCKGYWFEEHELYLLDPLGLKGVFQYCYISDYLSYYGDKPQIKGVGFKKR